MTIRPNNSGNFEASIQINGQRHYATFRTKTEAKDWKATMRSDASRHDLIAPTATRTPFGSYAARWIDTRTVAPATLARYDSLLRIHILPRWEHTPIGGILKTDIEGWVSDRERNASPATAASALDIMSMVLNSAVDDRLIRHNPATAVRPPKWTSRDMVVLEPGEFEAITEHLSGEATELVTALVFLGCRFGEGARLDVESVNWMRDSVTVDRQLKGRATAATKAHERRVLSPIPGPLRGPLRVAWERAHDLDPVPLEDGAARLLFRSAVGSPLDGNFRHRVWYPAVAAAGLDVRPRVHDLRHTCASWMLHSGVPLPVVSKWLGHRSVMTTANTYAGMLPSGFERAAEGLSEVWDGRRGHVRTVVEFGVG